ncbi:Long chain acyl-CoA synthetase 7, peroxisomal [Golovinomyces cichoracearum]|uniref:Long chain acyl-CoA synthetase 7, peroxisomal n=1 Tax=Golovinomyces cichoracearum TaxID=62708 RepID=A0A420HP41_9PEZI|nr:Long chain acyl-CoA synthetase 7, peroxisomal [Golovinomyces cichoracearum]
MSEKLTGEAYACYLRTAPPNGSPFSLPIPGSEKEDRTPIYRHWRFLDKPLLKTMDPKILTIHDTFEATLKTHRNQKCLGSRPWKVETQKFGDYEWLTYGEVAKRRENFGKGLVELHRKAGVTAQKYGVGLWCQNRPEWQIADLGCMSQSIFSVSIYDTLGPEATEHIINCTDLVCVMSSLEHIPTLLRLAPKVPVFKFIVCLDSLDDGDRPGSSKAVILNAISQNVNITIYSMKEVEALGAKSNLPMNPPRPDDLITINFTSGTAGLPKGVVLTHSNAVAGVASARTITSTSPSESLISYLPLAHIFERVVEQGCFNVGSSIGYFRGDVAGLVEDMKVLRPGGFIGVPRVYNRFASVIRSRTVEGTGLSGALARHIIETKKSMLELPPGQATVKHRVYDYFYAHKVRSALGLQNLNTLVTGSAPLDPAVLQFIRAAFGRPVCQGYGLTETYAIGSCQHLDDCSVGNCGMVAPGMEICLQSVHEMEYLVTDSPYPRGELLLRGTCLFKGYHKDPEETAKAFLPDGFFRTGDIAEIDNLGRIRIIDRLKNVLKLAQGEYLSPERIENVFMGSLSLFTQVYVHGDSNQSFLVALCGVEPVNFAAYAGKILSKTIAPDDLEAVRAAARNIRVRKEVIKDLDIVARKNKFNSFERIRNVWLEVEPFTIQNNLLTPTLKLKRSQTVKKYRDEIDALYAESLADESLRAKL